MNEFLSVFSCFLSCVVCYPIPLILHHIFLTLNELRFNSTSLRPFSHVFVLSEFKCLQIANASTLTTLFLAPFGSCRADWKSINNLEILNWRLNVQAAETRAKIGEEMKKTEKKTENANSCRCMWEKSDSEKTYKINVSLITPSSLLDHRSSLRVNFDWKTVVWFWMVCGAEKNGKSSNYHNFW